jgi:hypothetical protein
MVFWRHAIHWPAIIAGAFTALALFGVAGILARAVGLGWTYRSALTTGEQAGAVIWGGVAALICFAIGGFVAAKIAHRGSGGLNGFLVWAVCVPVMLFWLGSGMNPMLSRTESGRMYGSPAPLFGDDTRESTRREEFRITQPEITDGRRDMAQSAAWWSLVALAMGLIGAAGAGAITANSDRRYWLYDRERAIERDRAFADRDRPTGSERSDWVP